MEVFGLGIEDNLIGGWINEGYGWYPIALVRIAVVVVERMPTIFRSQAPKAALLLLSWWEMIECASLQRNQQREDTEHL